MICHVNDSYSYSCVGYSNIIIISMIHLFFWWKDGIINNNNNNNIVAPPPPQQYPPNHGVPIEFGHVRGSTTTVLYGL